VQTRVSDVIGLNREARYTWIIMMKTTRARTTAIPDVEDAEITALGRTMFIDMFDHSALADRVGEFARIARRSLGNYDLFKKEYRSYSRLVSFSAHLYGRLLSPHWTVPDFFALIHLDVSAERAIRELSNGGFGEGTIMLRVSTAEQVRLSVSWIARNERGRLQVRHGRLTDRRDINVEEDVQRIAKRLDNPGIVSFFTERKSLDDFAWYRLYTLVPPHMAGDRMDLLQTWVYEEFPHLHYVEEK
jgi:hypothetical protein